MAKSSIIKLNSVLVGFFLFVESFIFPVFFCYLIFYQMKILYVDRVKIGDSVARLIAGVYALNDLINIAEGLCHLLLVPLNILVVWGLLIRKKLVSKPESFSDIFYPFIGTFLFLSYNLINYIPKSWNFYFIPEKWLLFFILFGFIIANIGIAISVIATYNLRNSFAVFVEVRKVIIQGLYKYVRHPIYSGYIIFNLGFCLSNPRLFYFIITLFFIMITIKRGRLEEQKIAKVSTEYRSYMKNTPFLFPIRVRKISR